MLRLYKIKNKAYATSPLSLYIVTIEDKQGNARAAKPCDHIAEARYIMQHGWFVDHYNFRYARDWLVKTGHLKRYYEAHPQQKVQPKGLVKRIIARLDQLTEEAQDSHQRRAFTLTRNSLQRFGVTDADFERGIPDIRNVGAKGRNLLARILKEV